MTEHQEVMDSLAAKLNSLELTDDERAVFGSLLGADDDKGEVAGFSKPIYVGNLPVIQGFNIGMPPRLTSDANSGPSKVYDLNPNDLS